VKKGTGLLAFFLILFLVGCGKKGPPLPPLVRLPAAPREFSVQRRGSTIGIQFVVPDRNTDGSTPADLSHVDVYGLTGPSTVTPDEIFKRGTRVARVLVNPPEDPDADEGSKPPPVPGPPGALDQGGTARTSEAFRVETTSAPADVRSYIVVGYNKRGRQGALSPKIPVPTALAPNAPGRPDVTWDETTITVKWPAPSSDTGTRVTYHVYQPGDNEVRLTTEPLEQSVFADHRVEWGAERCYVVRSVEIADGLPLESEASSPACATLVDTFPPAAPVGLNTAPAEGAINLIWDPNHESDLAGYLVLRAIAPDTMLVAITPQPIVETTFKDAVPAGARVTFAVQAVDKAGNVSRMSAPMEETAR
jgi:hypothetical protein